MKPKVSTKQIASAGALFFKKVIKFFLHFFTDCGRKAKEESRLAFCGNPFVIQAGFLLYPFYGTQ